MKPSDLYGLPMRPIALDRDATRPSCLGLGVATKNNTDVQVLIFTCKDPQLARQAYALVHAFLQQGK